jgi:hypothetical protein
MRKVPNKNCYRVSNRKSKRVMAKCASKKNAIKQLRLLRAIQNNKNFVPRKSAKKGRMQKGGSIYNSIKAFFGYGNIEEEKPGVPSAPPTNSSSSGDHGVVNNTSPTSV